jgi:hypothetical protein
MSALRSLLAIFDTKVNAAPLEHLNGKLEETKGLVEKVGGVLAGLFIGHEVKEFISHQIEAGDALVDLSDKLGVGTEELQQFQYAASIFGVAGEESAHSLQFLNRNVGLAIEGNAEASKSFAQLKVPLKDASGQVRELGDLIPEIADAFAEMKSQPERVAKAMAIFGRQGAALLPLLMKGAEGVKELKDEFEDLGGGMSKEFLHAADEAGDELTRFSFAANGLKSELVLALIPTIKDLTSFAIKTVMAFRQFTKETNFAKTAFIGILSTGVIAAFAIFSADVLLTAAAFGALYLIGDELFTLFTGGDTLIGDFIDSMGEVGDSQKFVQQVTDAWNEMTPTLKDDILPTLKEIFSKDSLDDFIIVVEGVIAVFQVFKDIVDSVAYTIKTIAHPGQFISDAVTALQNTGIPLGKDTNDRLNAIKASQLGDINSQAQQQGIRDAKGFTGKDTIGAPDALQFGPPVAPGFRAGNVEQTNHVQITVQGGSSPEATGRNTSQGVKDGMAAAMQNAYKAVQTSGGAI